MAWAGFDRLSLSQPQRDHAPQPLAVRFQHQPPGRLITLDRPLDPGLLAQAGDRRFANAIHKSDHCARGLIQDRKIPKSWINRRKQSSHATLGSIRIAV